MKKLIALFAIVVLCSTFVFASSPTWNSGNRTGQFTATVECTPTLTPETAQGPTDLGTFFNDNASLPVTGTFDWLLKGDAASTYTMTTNVTVDPNITLTGTWHGTFPDATLGSLISGIGCEGAGHTIGYTVTNIQVGTGAGAGQHTWTVTLTTSVSI